MKVAEPVGVMQKLRLPRYVVIGVEVAGHAANQQAQRCGAPGHAIIGLWAIEKEIPPIDEPLDQLRRGLCLYLSQHLGVSFRVHFMPLSVFGCKLIHRHGLIGTLIGERALQLVGTLPFSIEGDFELGHFRQQLRRGLGGNREAQHGAEGYESNSHTNGDEEFFASRRYLTGQGLRGITNIRMGQVRVGYDGGLVHEFWLVGRGVFDRSAREISFFL